MPQDGGTTVRGLAMPPIRDRVVQGARTLILEPIVEADVQPGAYGYRPQRSAQAAVRRVAEAIVQEKTRGIALAVQAVFYTGRHPGLLANVAQRLNVAEVRQVLPSLLKASGTKGVPPGGVISPWLSHLYLTEVDRMLERAKEVTQRGTYTYIE